MADPLIPDELLTELIALHESAMRSTARILFHAEIGRNSRGQMTYDPVETERYAEPIKCNVISSGGPGVAADSERTFGGRLSAIGLASIQFPVKPIVEGVAVDLVVEKDDEIEVTTVLPSPSGDRTTVARYKAVGQPVAAGSYGTALTVGATRIV